MSRAPAPGAVRVKPKAPARSPAALNRIHHEGPDDRPPLVLAHGLYGSARNWGAVARRLAADRRVVAVDMRNPARPTLRLTADAMSELTRNRTMQTGAVN